MKVPESCCCYPFGDGWSWSKSTPILLNWIEVWEARFSRWDYSENIGYDIRLFWKLYWLLSPEAFINEIHVYPQKRVFQAYQASIRAYIAKLCEIMHIRAFWVGQILTLVIVEVKYRKERTFQFSLKFTHRVNFGVENHDFNYRPVMA